MTLLDNEFLAVKDYPFLILRHKNIMSSLNPAFRINNIVKYVWLIVKLTDV